MLEIAWGDLRGSLIPGNGLLPQTPWGRGTDKVISAATSIVFALDGSAKLIELERKTPDFCGEGLGYPHGNRSTTW